MAHPIPTSGTSLPSRAGSGLASLIGSALKGIGMLIALPFVAVYKGFGLVFDGIASVLQPLRSTRIALDRHEVGHTSGRYSAALSAMDAATTEAEKSIAFSNLAKEGNNFHQAIDRLNFDRGDFGTSAKTAVKSIGNTLGMDTSRWFTKGTVEQIKHVIESGGSQEIDALRKTVLRDRVHIIERVASKPLRIAAKHPVLALVAGAGAATAGVASWLSGRQEERTRGEAMTQIAEAQMAAAQRNPYMNSVTPEETALMESRFRNSGTTGGLAERVRPAGDIGQQPA